MVKIEYPEYHPRIEQRNTVEYIFDGFRKQWLVLTPEEWVRQNFLQYLVKVKRYPASLIAIEKMIRSGELANRFDIVVYDRATRPWMIIECKEMGVSLAGTALDQVLRYNMSLKVPFIVITNGIHCHAFAAAAGSLAELDDLPGFGE